VEKRCIFYRGADHSFHNDDLKDFISEVLNFLGRHLQG